MRPDALLHGSQRSIFMRNQLLVFIACALVLMISFSISLIGLSWQKNIVNAGMHSYEECLLVEMEPGGDVYDRLAIKATCQHRFHNRTNH